VSIVDSSASDVSPAPVRSTDPPWYEFLASWWFQLALLVWLCVLSVLLVALAACLCHICRRQRYCVHRDEVAGLATQSTTLSPTSPGHCQNYLISAKTVMITASTGERIMNLLTASEKCHRITLRNAKKIG